MALPKENTLEFARQLMSGATDGINPKPEVNASWDGKGLPKTNALAFANSIMSQPDDGNVAETPPGKDKSWNITRGVKSGLLTTSAVPSALLSMSAKLIGADELASEFAEPAMALIQKAEEYQPDISFKEVVKHPTIGGAVDWSMYMLGNVAPSMLAGGAGAAAGKKLLMKRFIKGAIKKNLKKGLTLELASKAAVSQAARKGAATGLVATTAGLEAAPMYTTDIEKHGIENARVAPHLIGGLASGLVELGLGGVEISIINKMFGKPGLKAVKKTPSKAIGFLKKAWQMAKIPAGEAAQELTQEEIAMLDEMFVAKPGEETTKPWSKEGLWRGAESAAAGFLPGAVGGAIESALPEHTQDVSQENLEQNLIDSVRNQLEDPASEVNLDTVKAMLADPRIAGNEKIVAGLQEIIKEFTAAEEAAKLDEDTALPGKKDKVVKQKDIKRKTPADIQKEIEKVWAAIQIAEGMENLPPETISLLRKAQELAPKAQEILDTQEREKAEAIRKDYFKQPRRVVNPVDEMQVTREEMRDKLIKSARERRLEDEANELKEYNFAKEQLRQINKGNLLVSGEERAIYQDVVDTYDNKRKAKSLPSPKKTLMQKLREKEPAIAKLKEESEEQDATLTDKQKLQAKFDKAKAEKRGLRVAPVRGTIDTAGIIPEALESAGAVKKEPVKPKVKSIEPKPEKIANVEVEEIPLEKIKLSKEVPQFKEGADERGIVEPLEGKYERIGSPPVVLWERKNGDLELITGRHRFDLAKKTGEKTIPAQILKETSGFTAQQAAIFDAESNIRDEKGSVRDYATYFRETGITKEQAFKRGLLSRAKGQTGFIIGKYASDDLYAIYRNGDLSEKKVAVIAKSAPGNSDLQNVGVKYASNHNAFEVGNYLQAVKSIKSKAVGNQINLFGEDESWQIEADKMAKAASNMETALRQERTLLKSAGKLNKKKYQSFLDKYGIKAGDAKAIASKIQELNIEIEKLDNWAAYPEIIKKIKEKAGIEATKTKKGITDETSQVEITEPTPLEIITLSKEDLEKKYPDFVKQVNEEAVKENEPIEAINDAIKQLQAEIVDWKNRKYKKNKTVVGAGGTKDDFNSTLVSIGQANENRRSFNINTRKEAISILKEAISEIETGVEETTILETMADSRNSFVVGYAERRLAEKAGIEKSKDLAKKEKTTTVEDELQNFGLKVSKSTDSSGNDIYLLTGDTFKYKEDIKATKLAKWQPQKKAWGFYEKAGLNRLANKLTGSRTFDEKPESDREDSEPAPGEGSDDKRLQEASGTDISDRTKSLIVKGIDYGIPEKIINEQIEDIKEIFTAFNNKKKVFILGNEAGTGKTFVIGGFLREALSSGDKTVTYVTTSQNLISQIKQDLKDFGITGKINFITYAKMREGVKTGHNDIIVFDEGHNIKNITTKQGIVGKKLIQDSDFVLIASATPFENPTEAGYLGATGVFKPAGGFYAWAKKFGASTRTVSTSHGDREILVWEGSTEDTIAANKWLKDRGLMVSRDMQIPSNMVETSFKTVSVDPKWKKLFNTVTNALEEMAADVSPKMKFMLGGQRTGLQKRILEASKIDAGIELAKKEIADGNQVVIFVETKAKKQKKFQDVINDPKATGVSKVVARALLNAGIDEINIPAAETKIKKAFGLKNTAIYTGSVSDKKAQENLQDWRDKKKQVLVVTMDKGGTGLSLHDLVGDRPTTQININLPWKGTKVAQVSGRIARYGLKSKAKVYWLSTDDISFDAELNERVAKRVADMGGIVKGGARKNVFTEDNIKFETTQGMPWETKPAKPLTTEDIKKVFEKTNAKTGIDKNGNFWFKFKNFPKIIVIETDKITGNVKLQKGETLTGAYVPKKQIIFKTKGKGLTADIATVFHENWHLFKDMGVLTGKDIFVLHNAIRKSGYKGAITEETEAKFVGNAMAGRQTDTMLGKVLQKIADFFDAIAHLLGFRTMQGLLKDIETGKITEQKPAEVASLTPSKAFQAMKTAERFYSQVIKTVETKMPAKMQASAVMNWLKKQPGVKPAELEWMNIEEMLEGKKSIGRDELVELLRENQVVVEESEKGGVNSYKGIRKKFVSMFKRHGANEEKANKLANKLENQESAEAFQEAKRYSDIDVDLNELSDAKAGYWGQTKFSKYQLEGEKENYYELLFKYEPQLRSDIKAYSQKLQSKAINILKTEKYKKLFKNELKKLNQIEIIDKISLKNFVSQLDFILGYYSSALSSYGTSELGKIYKQANLKHNKFRSSHWDEPNVFAHVRVNERTDADGNKILFVEESQPEWAKALMDEFDTFKKEKYPQSVKLEKGKEKTNLEKKAKDDFVALKKKNEYGAVPFMPLWDNAQEVIWKRIIRMAAEEGFDKIAWITGQQTADRYDLSKQVDRIEYRDGELWGFKDGEMVIKKSADTPKELESLVGKDIAEKILKQDAKAPGKLIQLRGDDLKIGANWAYALYDKMIPQFLKKFGKKYKATVGTTKINGVKQHSFTITSELKQAALVEGMPLFQTMAKEFGISSKQLQKEFEETKAKYKGTNKWLKAPNGKPSNLNEYAWVMTHTPRFKEWFGDSKVVDENGEPLVVYSGHSNVELWGTKWNKKKATAGAFFSTTDPKIASGYALSKIGVKGYYENADQYRLKNKSGNFTKKVSNFILSDKQLKKLDEIKQEKDEYGDFIHPVSEMDNYITNNKNYDKIVKSWANSGGSKNLLNIWNFYEMMGDNIAYAKQGDASIVERQQKNSFEELLDELDIKWQSYEWAQPGVIPLYLSIQKPFDTSKPFPKDLLEILRQKAKRERIKTQEEIDSVLWTKEYPLREWVKDIEKSTDTYWATQVPSKALPIFKQFGYDGIKDIGGKGSSDKHVVWIAFEPSQIKSIYNTGAFSKTDPDIRYETKKDTQVNDFVKEELKKAGIKSAYKKLNQTPEEEFKAIREEKGELLRNFKNRFSTNRVPSEDMKWYHRAFESPSMLARRYISMKKALDIGVKAQEKRIKQTNEIYRTKPVHSAMTLQDAQETITKDKKANAELEKLIWEWDDERFPKEKVPTNFFKHVKADNSLQIQSEHYREAANYLKSQEVSQKVIDAFIAIRKAYDKVLIDTHNKLLIEDWLDRTDIEEFRSAIGKIHNFFPHKRYGDTAISIRDKTTKELVYNEHYMDFKERFLPVNRQAYARAEKWLKENKDNPDDYVIQKPYKITKLPDQVFHNVDLSAMQQILDTASKKMVEAENQGAVKAIKDNIKKEMKDLMAKAIADVVKSRAWAGHAIGRKGIPGYETGDIWGTMFDYFTGWAGFTTKMDTARQYAALLRTIDAKKNPNEYQYVSTYVRDMLTNKNHVDRAVDFVRGLFFVKYLGFVAKSGLVNLTQNFVLAAPVLSLYTKGSTFKLSKAMIDTRRTLTSLAAWKGKDVKYGKHIKEIEAKALNQLVEEGTAQDQMLRELKGTIPAHGAMKLARKVIDKSGIFMQLAEKFNRASTGLAAFRIAYNEGIKGEQTKGNFDASVEFAKKIIYDAHFLYGDLNLPSAFRGGDFRKIIRSGYTFRTFTHQYLGMINHMFWNQKGGKAAVARSMRNLILLGGLTSLPFFKALSDVLAHFTDDDDEDLLTKIREKMPNQFMKDFAVYGLIGVGGMDITGSISIEVPRTFTDILGVPYAAIEDTVNTMKSFKSGAYKRAIAETPFTPIAVRNAIRGIELHTVGQRTRSGKDINYPGETGAKKITGWEAVKKGVFGIQPTSVSSGYKAYYALSKMKKKIAEKKTAWADRYVNAVRRGDEEERYKIIKEILEWNLAAAEDQKPWRYININRLIKNRMAMDSLRGMPKIQRPRALAISQAWH